MTLTPDRTAPAAGRFAPAGVAALAAADGGAHVGGAPVAVAALDSGVASLAAAVAALASVPRSVESCRAASDADLVEHTRLAAEARRLADAHTALAAGEIARRSAPELGGAGLARREGARTVEEFLRTTTGTTGRDAAVAVRVGRLTQETADAGTSGGGVANDRDGVEGDGASGAAGARTDVGTVVGAVVGARVVDGTVSVPAAEAIRAGLDGAGAVDPELVARATELLCDEARTLDPDRLLARAREVRDELDEAGIADREAALRARRSIRRIDLRDGMKRIIWDYDPETAGVVDEVYDRATSPRRGGPRFVDTDLVRRASDLERDDRTTEQLASDAFAELLRQAASLDPDVLVGSGSPGVRVLVSAPAIDSGDGHGVIEGSNQAVSIATARRLACANGTRNVLVDSIGRVLDLGREQRLYSASQRLALAVRDGGCMWPGCDRPPSWTEAHHIDQWARDGGRTDLHCGILLCRHHHLRLHNEGWKISLRAGRYWLEPPPGSGRTGAMLDTKSRALREHLGRSGPVGVPSAPRESGTTIAASERVRR